jgi:hypothetical protein
LRIYRRVIDVLIVITLILLAGYRAYAWWMGPELEDRHQCAVEAWPKKPTKDCAEWKKAMREGGPGTYLLIDGKIVKQPGSSGGD